jgi:hypothetical protein
VRCYKSLVSGYHQNTNRFVPVGRLFTSDDVGYQKAPVF